MDIFYIRIIPFSIHPRTVCLRVELTGCPYLGRRLIHSSFVSAHAHKLYSVLSLYYVIRVKEVSRTSPVPE
jgi:hypothetical protein